MHRIRIIGVVLLLAAAASATSAVEKRTLKFAGDNRTYYLFVPSNAPVPAPLIVLLHGSGGNGREMIDAWKDLASAEGVILAAPDSRNAQMWSLRNDSPDFIRDVVEDVRRGYAVETRRVYLFGHSAGARAGLLFAFGESEYFAAAAIDAGALPPDQYRFIELAVRKIPIRMTIGADDQIVPPRDARTTRDVLVEKGFPVEFVEISNHTHFYLEKAADINRGAWAFLKQHRLDTEPYFQHYDVK